MIGFQPFDQWFVQFITIINQVAVGAAAIIAIIGYKNWRDEMVGKARFAAASKFMQYIFEFRYEVKNVRSFITSGYEYTKRIKESSESKDLSIVLDEWYARTNRLKELYTVLKNLNQASWEIDSVLGENNEFDLIQPFNNLFTELASAIEVLFQLRISEATTGEPSSEAIPFMKIVYGVNDESDVFFLKLEKEIENVKSKIAKQVIRRI